MNLGKSQDSGSSRFGVILFYGKNRPKIYFRLKRTEPEVFSICALMTDKSNALNVSVFECILFACKNEFELGNDAPAILLA